MRRQSQHSCRHACHRAGLDTYGEFLGLRSRAARPSWGTRCRAVDWGARGAAARRVSHNHGEARPLARGAILPTAPPRTAEQPVAGRCLHITVDAECCCAIRAPNCTSRGGMSQIDSSENQSCCTLGWTAHRGCAPLFGQRARHHAWPRPDLELERAEDAWQESR
jgi:hypothetical protein